MKTLTQMANSHTHLEDELLEVYSGNMSGNIFSGCGSEPTWAESTAETYGHDPTSSWSCHLSHMNRRKLNIPQGQLEEQTSRQPPPRLLLSVPTTTVSVQKHHFPPRLSQLPPHCLVTLIIPKQGYPQSDRWRKDIYPNIYSHYLNLYSSQLVFNNVEAKTQPCRHSSSKL